MSVIRKLRIRINQWQQKLLYKPVKTKIIGAEKDKVKLTKFKEDFKGVELYFVPFKTEIHKSREFNNEILKYVTTNKREC